MNIYTHICKKPACNLFLHSNCQHIIMQKCLQIVLYRYNQSSTVGWRVGTF